MIIRNVFPLITYLLFLSCASTQNQRKETPLQKDKEGVLYLAENGRDYKVLHDIIVVKLKDSSDRSAIAGLEIIDINILGYIDLKVPQDTSLVKLVENLRKHPNVETVDYNSEGIFE